VLAHAGPNEASRVLQSSLCDLINSRHPPPVEQSPKALAGSGSKGRRTRVSARRLGAGTGARQLVEAEIWVQT
jgi:hypothetical protein